MTQKRSGGWLFFLVAILLAFGTLVFGPVARAQTTVGAYQLVIMTNGYVLFPVSARTNAAGIFKWLDEYLSTNSFIGTAYVHAVVNAASNSITNWTWEVLTNETADLASTNWVKDNFISDAGNQVSNQHMAANSVRGSNIVDGSVATADMATQRAFHATSDGGTTVISVPGAADLTLDATPAMNTMGSWNGSTTLVITNAGVYSFDAEAHFPGADLNFRDINKILQVVWNGSDIANAKADGADAIVTISGHFAFPLDSGTGQVKLVATIQTNVGYALSKPASVTCSFARMRMVLIGPYQALGL